MSSKKEITKKKIMDTTLYLLDQSEDPDTVTVRRIAEAAGVGAGLINYYYQSRDNLINEAIGMKMTSLAEVMEKSDGDMSDPKSYLKEMLIALSDTAAQNRRLSSFSAEYNLLKGDYKTCLYLLPVLRRVYNNSRPEMDLRLIAYQIIVAMQSVYFGQESFLMFTGINIEIKQERDSLIHSIVDNLIK